MAAGVLVGSFIGATRAPLWSKVLVGGLLLISFFWEFGLYLQVALGIFITLFLSYTKGRG